MHAYQELTLIPSDDINPYFIWGKLYMQLHLALVEVQNPNGRVNIGVSFPKYRYQPDSDKPIATLGNQLRIFVPDRAQLEALNLSKWLERLADYVHLRSIQDLSPDKISGHLQVSRFRQDKNQQRLTRRYADRHDIKYTEAERERNQRYAETHGISLAAAERHYDHPKLRQPPYINMQSLSGNQQYRLEINQQPTDQAQTGTYNTYGLSSIATVPNW